MSLSANRGQDAADDNEGSEPETEPEKEPSSDSEEVSENGTKPSPVPEKEGTDDDEDPDHEDFDRSIHAWKWKGKDEYRCSACGHGKCDLEYCADHAEVCPWSENKSHLHVACKQCGCQSLASCGRDSDRPPYRNLESNGRVHELEVENARLQAKVDEYRANTTTAKWNQST